MTTAIARTTSTASTLREISRQVQMLDQAVTPEDVLLCERALEGLEHLMRGTGIFKPDQIREANEGKIRARWKLGKLLAKLERQKVVKTGKLSISRTGNSIMEELKRIGLDKSRASEAQRIGTLPEPELEKTLAGYRGTDDFVSIDDLISAARPYWFKANRVARHREIHAGAAARPIPINRPGPFPLLYADTPTRFEVFSDKGLERSADSHYPTLTYEEIADFKIAGVPISEIAHDDAALFLWCTSSNIPQMLKIMDHWGFEFRTSAAWDKQKIGTGYVFRNQHELLLYGVRGSMPAPQVQYPSVFSFPRGEHSAKPPEIRTAIETMYPDFDQSTRLELFARGPVPGWTVSGLEAQEGAAA